MWRKYSRRAASATISETASSASRVQTFASRSTRSYHSSKTQTAEGWPREAAILTTVGLGLSALAAGSYALSTVHAAPEKKPTSLDNWPTYTEPKESWAGSIAAGTIVGGAALAFFGYAVSRYRRCPSNQILVIQGKVLGAGGRSARCMHGGGAFVWPIFQEYAYISLEPLQIEANLKKALSLENIRVNVPSVFTVAISTNEKIMENAAKRLLGLSPPEIKIQAQDIIFGQLRQVIASMRIDDINKSRDQFVAAVSNNIEAELNKIGLMLINVNITDITDESGYLESIGRKAAQEAVQKAEIDVSEQEKLGAIGVAENKKEAALRIAEMAREQRIGEAKADSEAIFGENEAKVTIAESNARLQIRSAEAYKEAESRKREAEAFVKEAQYRAEAKTALAEAERIEAEKRAELVSPANAKKAETLVQASATAEQMKIAAAAEAEAMYARMEAKARGDFQIMEKKALGMRLMVESAGGSKEAFQMLMLEHVDHLADSSAKAISNLKFDKIVVWDSGNANGGNSATSNFIKGIASALPPTMHMMRDIAGVDLPTYFGSLRPEEGGTTTGEGKTAIPPVAK